MDSRDDLNVVFIKVLTGFLEDPKKRIYKRFINAYSL